MHLIRHLAAAVACCFFAVASKAVPKTYFVELSNDHLADGIVLSLETTVKRTAELSIPVQVRYKFRDRSVFYGVSVSLGDELHVGSIRFPPGVKNVVPVQQVMHPNHPAVVTSRTVRTKTTRLRFKPEMAAPGGMILATFPLMEKSGGYGIISGTSMATP
ncbi:subtilisin-like protease (peptidase) [Colletotrichum tofieldiae]|uniref:Subtilisin-like protease (Peptidase) n=1 Tax=Colletotrichum tofieldiae TaxID=708197 RepID=A0A166XUW3_9PEZI|nr:subtilisin-like protease (peptidase) [Colletotrichum tofieldiae]